MIVVYGTRLMGKIEHCSGSYIATRFFHIYWMPLIPLGSHVVMSDQGDGSFQGAPAGLHLRSMLSAYLRTWGVLGAILSVVAIAGSFGNMVDDSDVAGAAQAGVLTFLCVTAAVLGWAVVGRLSRDDKGMRLVYQDHLGFSVDPAALSVEARQNLRSRLLSYVLQRAPAFAGQHYRGNLDPQTQWPELALDGSVGDPAFLSAAMTLARVEATLNTGSARARFSQAHRALWDKLKRINTVYLDGAAMA